MSSADPLSPCDFSEAFSPPITPGLAPPFDAAGVSVHPCSPLLSPDPLIPSFEVTPYLHPKYLFADFALPRKKVCYMYLHYACCTIYMYNFNLYTKYVLNGIFLSHDLPGDIEAVGE